MKIGNVLLEDLTRANSKWRTENKAVVIEDNSCNVFDDEFMEKYHEMMLGSLSERYLGNLDFRYGVIQTLCREYGLNLGNKEKEGGPLRTLQIGSGPASGFLHGPRLDKLLLELGADTMNLDIADAGKHYDDGRFIQASWFDVHNIFEKNEFDAIFMYGLNGDREEKECIHPDITGRHDGWSDEREYLDLIMKTMSIVKKGGIFLNNVNYSTDFEFPDNVNDLVNKIGIEYNKIHTGYSLMHIYKWKA